MPRIPKFDNSGLRQSSRVGAGDVTGLIDNARSRGRADQSIAQGIGDVAAAFDKFEKVNETEAYFDRVNKYRDEISTMEAKTKADWDPGGDQKYEDLIKENTSAIREKLDNDMRSAGRMTSDLNNTLNKMASLKGVEAKDFQIKQQIKFADEQGKKRVMSTAAAWTTRTSPEQMLNDMSIVHAETQKQGENHSRGSHEISELQKSQSGFMMKVHMSELVKTPAGSAKALQIIDSTKPEDKKLLEGLSAEETLAIRNKALSSVATGRLVNKTELHNKIGNMDKMSTGIGKALNPEKVKQTIDEIVSVHAGEPETTKKFVRIVLGAQAKSQYSESLRVHKGARLETEKNKILNGINDDLLKKDTEQAFKTMEENEFKNRKENSMAVIQSRIQSIKSDQTIAMQMVAEGKDRLKSDPNDQEAIDFIRQGNERFQRAVDLGVEQSKQELGIVSPRVTVDNQARGIIEAVNSTVNHNEIAELIYDQRELWGDHAAAAFREANAMDKDGFPMTYVLAGYMSNKEATVSLLKDTVGWDGKGGKYQTLYGPEGKGKVAGISFSKLQQISREVGVDKIGNLSTFDSKNRRLFSEAFSDSVAKKVAIKLGPGDLVDDMATRSAVKDAYDEIIKDSFVMGEGRNKYAAPTILGYDKDNLPIHFNKRNNDNMLFWYSQPDYLSEVVGWEPDEGLVEHVMKRDKLDREDAQAFVRGRVAPSIFFEDNKDFNGVIAMHESSTGPVPLKKRSVDSEGEPILDKDGNQKFEFIELSYDKTSAGINNNSIPNHIWDRATREVSIRALSTRGARTTRDIFGGRTRQTLTPDQQEKASIKHKERKEELRQKRADKAKKFFKKRNK
jgi:hypothetical protein